MLWNIGSLNCWSEEKRLFQSQCSRLEPNRELWSTDRKYKLDGVMFWTGISELSSMSLVRCYLQWLEDNWVGIWEQKCYPVHYTLACIAHYSGFSRLRKVCCSLMNFAKHYRNEGIYKYLVSNIHKYSNILQIYKYYCLYDISILFDIQLRMYAIYLRLKLQSSL